MTSIINKENIPWVEKYRPNNFDNIVLEPINKKIFKNILNKNYFPNLLFYGPPGTGKTTTIINLINEYQNHNNSKDKSKIIHLNASDERGIDIIRNQIHQFVKSNNLFDKGLKFVILDEVDYMTKNAQQALKYLLQSSSYNVRYCLICNYISKIDESLKNEFICIRFNQLPKNDILKFINNIIKNENINLSEEIIEKIQEIYNSDIRSIINFIQLNQNINKEEKDEKKNEQKHEQKENGKEEEIKNLILWKDKIISDDIWERIHNLLLNKIENNNWKNILNDISLQYNIDKRSILKNYFNYIIRKKKELISLKFLNIVECIMHSNDSNIYHVLLFFVLHMQDYLSNIK